MQNSSVTSAVLDHLVIISSDLERGVAYCEETLGVRPQAGGQHARMGTHNCLLRLGASAYLEVIAIDPAADSPAVPRWFGLDSRQMRDRLADGPFLATFVARTEALDAAVTALPELGRIQPMQRGDLHWRITIRDDGMPIDSGVLPPLIAWPDGIPPTARMTEMGCRLTRLEVRHPDPLALAERWRRIGLDRDSSIVILPALPGELPYLVAHIDTPLGCKVLSGKRLSGKK